MSLEFQEESEDRQFEPGREHFIFLSSARCGIVLAVTIPWVDSKVHGKTSFRTARTYAGCSGVEVEPVGIWTS